MQELQPEYFNLPDEVKLHIFSFFGARESCRFSQVNTSLGKLLSSYRLHREYEIFRKEYETSKKNQSPLETFQLINSVDDYKKYCNILVLDKDCLQVCEIDSSMEIIRFAGFLAINGLIFSLSILYSDHRIDGYFRQRYDAFDIDKSFYSYEKWFRNEIVGLKRDAAYFGAAETIQHFFPDIVDVNMLVIIIEVMEMAYNLGEHLITNLRDQIPDESTKLHKLHCLNLLSANLNGYRKSIQYLLKKGVVTDLSDNDLYRAGAVSYLSETDSNISIRHFCTLYRDFVPVPVRELFDLILNSKPVLLPDLPTP